ncbi:MAG: hypothetical protein LBM95_08790 [Lactobacillales bacterium]|jgi:DNA-directed RNA polymerase specialized sigma24 family protein|nr:hypothetical protein [Lactobacillales bacterium]
MNTAEEAFIKYTPLIYGAIKESGVRRYAPDYEDYEQEAKLTFLLAYQEFTEKQAITSENERAFRNFTFTRILWTLNKKLRKMRRQHFHENYPDNEMWEAIETTEPLAISSVNQEFVHFLEQVWGLSLTRGEQIYLVERVFHFLGVQEIADKHHVTRQTIRNWGKKLKEKINDSNFF